MAAFEQSIPLIIMDFLGLIIKIETFFLSTIFIFPGVSEFLRYHRTAIIGCIAYVCTVFSPLVICSFIEVDPLYPIHRAWNWVSENGLAIGIFYAAIILVRYAVIRISAMRNLQQSGSDSILPPPKFE